MTRRVNDREIRPGLPEFQKTTSAAARPPTAAQTAIAANTATMRVVRAEAKWPRLPRL